MVNAIKFNKNLHRLSKNEMGIYLQLQKFLNKEQDINVLIEYIYQVIILKNYIIKFLQYYIID